MVVGIIHLPSPQGWHGQADFNYVFGSILTGVPALVLAIFLGRFLNLYILTKTKLKLHGRYFWIRSIVSSFFGDMVTLSILYPLAFPAWPFHQLFHFFLSDLGDRVFYSMIGGGPALLLVIYLKKKECIDIYDNLTNFNPFKTEI